MSKIQDVPFITKVIDTLSDELKSGLYDLIDGQVKTPVFRSLVNNDYAITEANDKGKVQFVTLETLRGNYTGYLAYNSVYCVLIAFKGNTQALDMLNINVAKHTFAFVNESLSILELRVELEDGKEGVTPTDLGVTNNNIHLAKGTTQIGEGVNLKTVGGETIVGSGNVGFKTINNNSIMGSGDITITTSGTLTIDTALDDTSTNAVQNKVVTGEFNKYKSLLENYAVNIQFEDTSANILALTSDNGTGLGTDTGHWYYWNGTQYVDGGEYQATQIGDGSITYDKLSDDVKDIFNNIDDILENYITNYFDGTYLYPNSFRNMQSGVVLADANYNVSQYFKVKPGQTIFTTANVNGSTTRTYEHSIRNYGVFNEAHNQILDYDLTSQQCKYTNNTNQDVYVQFTLFGENNSSFTVTNLMVQIVDSIDDVKIEEYYSYDYLKSKRLENIEEDILNIENNLNGGVQPYFVNEIETVKDYIYDLSKDECVVLNIVTDNHYAPQRPRSWQQNMDTINNVKAVNKAIFCDGVISLGDIVSQSYRTEYGATNEQVLKAMFKYANEFRKISDRVFFTGGNHDGLYANLWNQENWYNIGERPMDNYIIRREGHDDFYHDYKAQKVRCIFIQTPDDDYKLYDNRGFGYSTEMLAWLKDVLLSVPMGYTCILFSHCANITITLSSQGNEYPMVNKNLFENMINSYNNKTGDFINANGSVRIMVCGHAHGDYVSLPNNQSGDNNMLNIPVVLIGANIITTGSDWGTAPERTDGTVTQDLWDTMIYYPHKNECKFIRFGAGTRVRTVELE